MARLIYERLGIRGGASAIGVGFGALMALGSLPALGPTVPLMSGVDSRLSAQETGSPVDAGEGSGSKLQEATRVTLEDGATLYGVIVRETDDEVELRLLSGGTVVLQRTTIKKLEAVEGVMKAGSFLPPDPNRSRLFWGPTARTVPQGQGYFGVYEIVAPFLTVGLTDWLTVGGGVPLIFSSDDGISALWLTPKIRLLHRERLDVSVGSFLLFETEGDDSYGAIHYAVLTAGDERASFTVGAGTFQGNLDGPGALMLGGQLRTSRSMKLMAEGYLAGGEGFVIVGPRFLGEKLSADVGLAIPFFDGGGTFVFPVVNFAYAW